MKSTQTTLWGVIGGIGILATQAFYYFDGDPATNFSIAVIMGALGLMGIGISARDNDKSSEAVGAK